MKEIIYLAHFYPDHKQLFDHLIPTTRWDERMASRKTASFGKAYNYSQIQYPNQPFSPFLQSLVEKVDRQLGFKPNNCLLNYYLDGNSKMGFHSDQTDILQSNTGVAILSLGVMRTLRFRSIANKDLVKDYPLIGGSLLYMPNNIQDSWQHAIPKSADTGSRISLSFRALK